MINTEQKVRIKWNNANKKYYESKGYLFTKIGEEFNVPITELSTSSTVVVDVVCDYCGEIYHPTYKNYNVCHTKSNKDACKNCSYKKAKDTMIKRYGVSHYAKTEECKTKKAKHFMEVYGVSNPSQLETVQSKKKQTNKDKFGTEWFVQSDGFKDMCMEKYGVNNPMKDADIKLKASQTLLHNGTAPVSREELKLVSLLKEWYGEDLCSPCYNIGRFVCDCLLNINGMKIDIEYDGAYWHKNRPRYDRARDEIIKNNGYKIIRILSNGKMPTFQMMQEAIAYLSNNHNFSKIDLT